MSAFVIYTPIGGPEELGKVTGRVDAARCLTFVRYFDGHGVLSATSKATPDCALREFPTNIRCECRNCGNAGTYLCADGKACLLRMMARSDSVLRLNTEGAG